MKGVKTIDGLGYRSTNVREQERPLEPASEDRPGQGEELAPSHTHPTLAGFSAPDQQSTNKPEREVFLI